MFVRPPIDSCARVADAHAPRIPARRRSGRLLSRTLRQIRACVGRTVGRSCKAVLADQGCTLKRPCHRRSRWFFGSTVDLLALVDQHWTGVTVALASFRYLELDRPGVIIHDPN